MGLTLHHVGCLVEDISAALETYKGTGSTGEVAPPVIVSAQKVRVCFLPVGNGTFLEFVQPDSDNAFLLRMLRKGISYYHVGYFCTELGESIRQFEAAGAHELTRFKSEAFGGRQCVFLITAQQQMVELIESP